MNVGNDCSPCFAYVRILSLSLSLSIYLSISLSLSLNLYLYLYPSISISTPPSRKSFIAKICVSYLLLLSCRLSIINKRMKSRRAFLRLPAHSYPFLFSIFLLEFGSHTHRRVMWGITATSCSAGTYWLKADSSDIRALLIDITRMSLFLNMNKCLPAEYDVDDSFKVSKTAQRRIHNPINYLRSSFLRK